jgi:hypothetical protein
MLANIANKGLPDPKMQSIMSGPILEKSHILANIVTKSSPNLKLQRDMKRPMLEKNHMLKKE